MAAVAILKSQKNYDHKNQLLPILTKIGTLMHLGPLHPSVKVKFRYLKNPRWQKATILKTRHCHLYPSKFYANV